jgi:ABC-type antimicrobial peptide transport system permease subunit
LSAVGVAAGIAAFVFFVALSQGVRGVVLGKIFPVDRLEVVPRTFDLGPLKIGGAGSSLGRRLDDSAVRLLAGLPGVSGAWPKQNLSFKAMGWAGDDLFGRSVKFEFFGDGIDPSLLTDEPSARAAFEAASVTEETEGPACNPKADKVAITAACGPDRYCVADTRRCARPVPVIVSAHLLEMYNGSAVRAFNTPKLSPDTLLGLNATLQFGRSFAGREACKPVLQRKVKVVGISDKAILFGATMPLEYVRRYNMIYKGPDTSGEFDSVVLKSWAPDDLGRIAEAASAEGFDLNERSQDARRAGWLLTIMTLSLTLISLAIVGIAAVHVAHGFFMVVMERKKELGLLRAVGATQADVRRLVMTEAIAVGLVSGVAGVAMALVASVALDRAAVTFLPDFPFRPDTYFAYPPSLLAAGVGLSVLFCVLGAAIPARKAARMPPAQALLG